MVAKYHFFIFIFLQIFQTTTLFSEVWANRGLFKGTLNETLRAYPNFKFYDTNEKIITKPPLYYFENYDFSDVSSAETLFQHSLIFICMYLCYIILLLCSIISSLGVFEETIRFSFSIRIPWFWKKNQTEQTVNSKKSGFCAAHQLVLYRNLIGRPKITNKSK